ncbi:styrene monooxygenase/indole monooxygenase family protein [Actinomadura opuntiae]|uniref:styrene monooxygenase/indole monooxygenase family protein n=1 Tax=Actinomadura sp. OS1-43 TaxID=604315 RepID=UPI00255B398E|nr:styrene monooxygenase/indole monooxygenase family protein [Actinomadura sp. OS1-43]MDL4815180.1 hypothetical protein [Actinomadura sp. OS1-43]
MVSARTPEETRREYHTATAADLEGFAARYDLTIVAAGRGDLVEVFERDASRSPYDRPQRHLSCIYLHGMTPWPGYPEPHVRINAAPQIGELSSMPGCAGTGPCDIVFWEAVPGGPFDCWDDRPDPAGHLA